MRTAHDSQVSPDGGGKATASEPNRGAIDQGGSFAVAAEFDPPRMTLALKGEFDLAGAPSLERELEALPWPQLAELVLDLAEVTFIDSTGLHVLLQASQRARTAGLLFSLVRVPEQPRKLFTIAGLTDSLNVQP